jgi:hypothetical protein
MRWKLSRPELAGPQSPYHQGFHHRLLAALLMVPKSSSADSLSASFLSSFCVFFIPFPWAVGFKLLSVAKQSESDLI